MTHIPLNDLTAHHFPLMNEIQEKIFDIIKTNAFIRSSDVTKFEEEFAVLMQNKFCVSCGNGTDALYIAMRGLNLRHGDEVIVPAQSWISTSQTVTQAGGRVVFADIDKNTHCIDVEDIKRKITSRTVGIIPVHLYGQAAEMDAIMKIAAENQLWVIEDCAQAHLSTYKEKQVGTFGDAATFSFYPGKNLGAMGDAGAIVTNQEALYQKMAKYARHGGLEKGTHELEGINSRMDGIQAAILNIKMPYLEEWTKKRALIAEKYFQLLNNIDELTLPYVEKYNKPAWHLFVIKHERRNDLARYLKENKVGCGISYPTALPFLPAYSYLEHEKSDFPNAYHNQSRVLSLPLYPELGFEQLNNVCDLIKNF